MESHSCIFDEMSEFTLKYRTLNSESVNWDSPYCSPRNYLLPWRQGSKFLVIPICRGKKKHRSGLKQNKWPNIGHRKQELRVQKLRVKSSWDGPETISPGCLYLANHLALSSTSVTTSVTCEGVSSTMLRVRSELSLSWCLPELRIAPGSQQVLININQCGFLYLLLSSTRHKEQTNGHLNSLDNWICLITDMFLGKLLRTNRFLFSNLFPMPRRETISSIWFIWKAIS